MFSGGENTNGELCCKEVQAICRIKTYGFFAPFFSAFGLLMKERSGRQVSPIKYAVVYSF